MHTKLRYNRLRTPRNQISTAFGTACFIRLTLSADDASLFGRVWPIHQGISFRFDEDWCLTDDGCAANPIGFHEGDPKGVKIKLQVGMCEGAVMPVASAAHH